MHDLDEKFDAVLQYNIEKSFKIDNQDTQNMDVEISHSDEKNTSHQRTQENNISKQDCGQGTQEQLNIPKLAEANDLTHKIHIGCESEWNK